MFYFRYFSRLNSLAILFFLFSNSLLAQQKIWSLKACIDEAVNQNLTLNNIVLNNENNIIDVKQNKATLLPSLNGNFSHNYQFGRSIDPSTNLFIQQRIQTNNVGLSSSVTLFNGFKLMNNIRQSQLNVASGKYDIEKSKNDVILQVTSIYLQILLNKEIVESAKVQIVSTESQAERTSKLVEAGNLPDINSYQIKSQLANDKLALSNAENTLAISKLNLMQTMNLPYTSDFDVETIALDNVAMDGINSSESQSIFETALKNQPQIRSAEFRVNSAEMGVRIAKGDHMPRLILFANVSTFYSDANRLSTISGTRTQQTGFVGNDPNQPVFSSFPVFSFQNYNFFNQLKDKVGEQVGLSLNIPIFNGKQVVSNVERNRVAVKIAKNNQQLVKNQLRQTIEQASTDLNNAKNNYAASQESLKFSEAALQNAEKRYAAGVMNITEYIIQKNNFFIAQVNLSQSKYDYVFKEKLLDFYKGNNIVF